MPKAVDDDAVPFPMKNDVFAGARIFNTDLMIPTLDLNDYRTTPSVKQGNCDVATMSFPPDGMSFRSAPRSNGPVEEAKVPFVKDFGILLIQLLEGFEFQFLVGGNIPFCIAHFTRFNCR
jgi:hypothetical protein